MKVYLIILLVYINSTVSQILNNESLLVFHMKHRGLFTTKFGKTINQLNENDSDLLVQTYDIIGDFDYSLSTNIIIWSKFEPYDGYYVLNAIPIDKW